MLLSSFFNFSSFFSFFSFSPSEHSSSKIGHGGNKAAQYASENLYTLFKNYLTISNSHAEALRQALIHLERDFLEKARREEIFDGTTVSILVCYDNKLLAANIGDSEIHLFKNEEVIPLCQIHNIGKNPSEKERVMKEGGAVGQNSIIHPASVYFGKISVSRSM